MGNLGFNRKSGIMMAISSLPSKYGIGTFGSPCYNFIDFLDKTGQTCWQILPLNPTAYGDSPYQSPSSMAGNPYFLDIDDFVNRGLLTKEESKDAIHPMGRVDYGWLFNTRVNLFRKAYSRFKKDRSYYSFLNKNKDWVKDYALFMALKVRFSYKSWLDWPEGFKKYSSALNLCEPMKNEIDFWIWIQYEFFTQWGKVRKYAKEKGIKIIGDMPIYVALDSVDVWSKPENYLLNSDFTPKLVAGVPPDGFTPDGQLWGNPIYDWKRMYEDGFSWWVNRIKQTFKMYDILRVDHFRGFAGHYVVPFGDKTARNGWWEKGYGMELFGVIKEKIKNARIIAEDLGYYTDEVGKLLDFTGYPGMKLLQFAFFDDDSANLPRLYPSSNCICYTGSFDADCTYTWCKHLSGETKKRYLKECNRRKGESRTFSLIRMAFESKAVLVLIPLQDYLELSNEEGRMNTPSTVNGNWNWRVSPRFNTPKLRKKIYKITKETNREKN